MSNILGFGAFDQSIQDAHASPSFLTVGPLTPSVVNEWAILADGYFGNSTVVPPGFSTIYSNAGQEIIAMTALPTTASVSYTGLSTGWSSNLLLFNGPSYALTAPITSVTVDGSNHVSITCTQSFIVGTQVKITGLTHATFLNNQTITITGNTGTVLTGNFTHVAYGPTGESAGTATNLPYLQIATANLGLLSFPATLALPNPVTAGSTILVGVLSSDVNAYFAIQSLGDGTNSYTIKQCGNTSSNAGTPYNHLAWAQSVAAGATTLTLASTVHSGSTPGIFIVMELPAGTGYSISGNAGVAGANVSYSGPFSGSVTADGSGNYTISGLLAAGTYTVTPSLALYTFTATSQSVVISSGNVTGINFTAAADPSSWTISGNVGIANAIVNYTGTASGFVVADGSGEYAIPGLSNGPYTITPSLTGYAFTPLNQPETMAGADIPEVDFTAVAVEVFISEVQIVVTYQDPGNFLYARDVNSWGDGGTYGANNGQPYPECNVVIGSISLSQPGALLFPLQHIVGYFDAVGTLNNGGPSQPDMWILPNEISAKTGIGFVYLPEILQEPPEGQTHPSATILALRWPINMMNSFQASQFVHHLQVKIQFEPENAPNTLKAISFKEDQS